MSPVVYSHNPPAEKHVINNVTSSLIDTGSTLLKGINHTCTDTITVACNADSGEQKNI